MAEKIEDGGPAFARSGADYGHGGNLEQDGMSLRDWFAGQALACIPLRAWDHVGNNDQERIEAWAKCAYLAADAMIAAREFTPSPTPTVTEAEE